MATIIYNDELIKKNLIPEITNAISNLNTTINTASSVVFYNGEVNWSNVKSELDSSLNDSKKYLEWLNTTSASFNSNVELFEEGISSVKVNEIKTRSSIVKKT